MANVPAQTYTLGVNHAEIYPITVDTVTTLTLAASAIDLPSIQSISYTANIDTKELMGDEEVQDYYAKIKSYNVDFELGREDFNAFAAMIGGTVTAGASTTYVGYDGGIINKYFQLGAVCKYVDTLAGVAETHVQFTKCKVMKYDNSAATEEYGKVSVSVMAIPARCTGVGVTGNRLLKKTNLAATAAITPIKTA